MSIRILLSTALVALVATAAPSTARADDDAAYEEPTEALADLADILSCSAGRDRFMRLGGALSTLEDEETVQSGLAGWRRVASDNVFVVEFELPAPVSVVGQQTRRVVLAGQGLLAVLDGDQLDTLSRALDLAPSELPLAGHVRVREARVEDLGDGLEVHVRHTASTISSHPGNTLVGCEYRVEY